MADPSTMHQVSERFNDDNLCLVHLLDGIVEKDRPAFERFYNATADRLFGLAVRITQSHDLAEEVLNDLYLQVWQQAARYNPERGTVMAWLSIMCRSRGLDIVRRRHKVASWEEPLDNVPQASQEPNGEHAQDLLIGIEQDAALHLALLKLDADSRQLLALAYFKDCTHGDMARMTGLPVGTVKSKIRRAIGAMKEAMATTTDALGGSNG